MFHMVGFAWNSFWWPQTGQWYAFWSSFGACLTYFAVIGVVYKHFKCQKCWRIAHHRVDGTHYKTCHHHATVADHDELVAKHARKFPQQHELFKRNKANAAKPPA